MLNRIIKSILFIAVIVPLSLSWMELINNWKDNTHTHNISILPIDHKTNAYKETELEGFITDIYLSNFDVENSKISIFVSVNYKRNLDQDGKFPPLRNVILNFYQPTNDIPFKSNITIPIDNYSDLKNSKDDELSVISNYPIDIPLYPLGWYPYEAYNIEIESEFVFSYPGGRGSSGTKLNLTAPSTLQNYITQYEVTMCDPSKPDSIFKDCEKLPSDIHKIIIQQSNERKQLFFVISVLFMVFTILIFWINELSSLLEVAVGLLLGIWGLRAVIIPDKIPFNISWGAEKVLMNFYISLGVIIIYWIFTSAVTSFLVAVSNPNIPKNISNSKIKFLWSTFPEVMNFIFVTVEYWDTKTVAEYLGVNPNSVREQAKNNKLPGEKVNNKWRFEAQKIMKIKNKQR